MAEKRSNIVSTFGTYLLYLDDIREICSILKLSEKENFGFLITIGNIDKDCEIFRFNSVDDFPTLKVKEIHGLSIISPGYTRIEFEPHHTHIDFYCPDTEAKLISYELKKYLTQKKPKIIRFQNTIKLIERRQESNFFSRNKDKILMLFIGALFGIGGTILTQALLRLLFPTP